MTPIIALVLAAAPLDTAPHPTFLEDSAVTRGYMLGRPIGVRVTPDGKQVLFLRAAGPRDPTMALYELDVASGQTRELLTPAKVLAGGEETLSAAEKARRERLRITVKGFTSFELDKSGKNLVVPLSGKLFLVDRATLAVKTLYGGDEPVFDPHLSPDGALVAYVKGADLYVREVASGKERALTKGGNDAVLHGMAEFVAQEEMDRQEGFWWSPDSKRLAYAEVDQTGMERFTIADPSKPEKAPDSFFYPRPGKQNAKVRLGLIDRAGGKTTWVRWDDAKYPYLARVLWKEAKAPLTVLVQARDQREEALLEVDEKTGATKPLWVEKDEAWLNLDDTAPRWLADGSGFLFASERDGAPALYLHDREGKPVRAVVPAKLRFQRLVQVSKSERMVYAVCTPTPLVTRLYKFPLDGGEPLALTPDSPAEHSPVMSEDGSVWVDTVSTATDMAVTTVFGPSGVIGKLPSVAEEPPFKAEVELLTVGERGYQAAVTRPRGFVKGQKYPVIVSVYGGPHVNVVRADQRSFLMSQWVADHGAIVVSVDNRGTPRRDRAWERAIRGSFGTIPIDDQIAGLKALAAKVPELDLTRVGIFGWSFGGYMSALAVLKHPEVFKVGVAGAPVVDWRDYDTHYTERYLWTPEENAKGYEDSNLLTYAPKLDRPLLVIHGTADDNVYFFHSLELDDAVFRAGKHLDFLPLAGQTHIVADPAVRAMVSHRQVDFLMQHLGTSHSKVRTAD